MIPLDSSFDAIGISVDSEDGESEILYQYDEVAVVRLGGR